MTGFLATFDVNREYQHAGMIDWLSLKIDLALLQEPVIHKLRQMTSRLCKINPDGDIDWTTFCWESVRSDSHQVSIRIGGHLYIQGSPARVGMPNNTFGSLDIQYCAHKMVSFAVQHLGLKSLPDIKHWTCSRIDVTRNYQMVSSSEARQALEYLKQSPEGRQKISFESNGLIIGKRSTLHRGKIYLKGQDARRTKRMGKSSYTEDQLNKADKLLRFELTLARHKIRRMNEQDHITWHQLTPEHLIKLHTDYFKEFISEADIKVTDMSDILERLIKVTPTEGQARAAYDCYTRIRMIGYSQAKVSFTKTSWYRHIKHLKNAGLTRADLQSINVIPLRKRAIDISEPVRHWDDIRLQA